MAARKKSSGNRHPDRATGKAALEAIREEIDALDGQLQELINQRARLAQRVGVSKHADGHTVDFYRPEREAQVLRAALERNHGPLRNEEIVRLFREIMSACLAQEEPLKVAFLGPEGTFTQAAVFKHFGHSVRALALQHRRRGVPGSGGRQRRFRRGRDREFQRRHHHQHARSVSHQPAAHLRRGGAAHPSLPDGQDGFAGRRARVCSHGQALAQCRGWLDEHLPDAERVPVASNAEGARRARDEQGTAAIAGETAAEVYGLRCWRSEIEDRADNATRFLVLGRKLLAPSGADRTTLLLSAGDTDRPGALHRLLEPLAQYGISMRRIESRPSRRANGTTCSSSTSRATPRMRTVREALAGAEAARLAVSRARLLPARGAL